jgi:hydroxylamine dehydrogenase
MSSKNVRRVWIVGLIFLVVLGVAVFMRQKASAETAFVTEPSAKCIKCHEEKEINRVQITEWEGSAHAEHGVGCFECHQAKEGDADAWEHEGHLISTIVSPFDCAKCHKQEFEEFDRSHHAKAGEILGSLDNFLGEAVEGQGASMQGCQYCHGSVVKVLENGKLDSSTWPNLGIGRLNPDGSKGSCSACHAKHSFSLAVARSPEACGKCHMGPDHPQKEIYEESKHGIIFAAHRGDMNLDEEHWVLGDEYTQTPNCVTCHMGANRYSKKTHDLGERISWNLRAPLSKPMPDSAAKREEMQNVCRNCHGPEWYGNFYEQLDATVETYENNFARPANDIMKFLKKEGKLTKTPFDEDIEWVYFELWHHEGRRLRHGAAMMGPDYVQWHGFYEVAKHFYFKFLPLAEKAGAKEMVDEIKSRPEHQWIKGAPPEGMRLQDAALKAWSTAREEALVEKTDEAH